MLFRSANGGGADGRFMSDCGHLSASAADGAVGGCGGACEIGRASCRERV